MRKILNKIFQNKKISVFVPLICAVIVYLLFVLFGTAKDKFDLIIMTPIASAFWFFGVFIVIYIQIKNAACPKWFLNLFELLITILFGIYAIIGTIIFVASGFQKFNLGICLAMVTYSAVSWAHSKRNK